MLITFIDDLVSFDGHSADSVPLGGPEKNLISLAVALAKRGHTVRVFNRCKKSVVANGVGWQPIEECDAAYSDWLIAHRDPSLLRRVPNAVRTAVWAVANAEYLDHSGSLSVIAARETVLILQSLAQSLTVPKILQSNAAEVVVPASLDCYRTVTGMTPCEPANAVVTTHPANGLNWLLGIWLNHVMARIATAEPHIYSSILARGAAGGECPASLRSILDRALGAREKGVKIFQPLPDDKMSEVYRRARLHLYPSHDRDLICTTLGDSQAVGLPAVARDKGAARERLLNGKSGYLATTDEDFADFTARILEDNTIFSKLSKTAKMRQRNRTWDHVAADFERALS